MLTDYKIPEFLLQSWGADVGCVCHFLSDQSKQKMRSAWHQQLILQLIVISCGRQHHILHSLDLCRRMNEMIASCLLFWSKIENICYCTTGVISSISHNNNHISHTLPWNLNTFSAGPRDWYQQLLRCSWWFPGDVRHIIQGFVAGVAHASPPSLR